ncbi:MAG: molybdopterin cofactor-binding domain-containing protein [Rhodospirillaceae bacterium]|nr:molybdopterin cofactor-binding domain-containing protein [Rhodospirillaceae bacterium]
MPSSQARPRPGRNGFDRRAALVGLAAAGGAFVLGVPRLSAQQGAAPSGFARFDPGGPAHALEHWVAIGRDNSVTVSIHLAEMGQGVATALPQLIAEELDVSWSAIRLALPRGNDVYYNRGYGPVQQSTGGSSAIRGQFVMFRQIGAVAREMLKAAAAHRWRVPVAELTTADGHVLHAASDRSAAYGELAADAARIAPPSDIELRPKSAWRLLGKPLPRLDTPAKVDGSAVYGMDVAVPGALIGTAMACPAYGGRLRHLDPAPAKAVPGVVDVVALEDAVAVVATGYWPALKGLQALSPEWDLGPRADYDNAALDRDFTEALARTGAPVLIDKGDVAGAMSTATATVSVEYEAPYLAHVCMEPMNATVDVRADGVEIWMSSQSVSNPVEGVAKALGIDPAAITFHRTYLGGGFGRRGEADVAVQAALVSRVVGKPVKLIWSREDDVRRDFYRPAARMRLTAALDAQGLPAALDIVNACPSISLRRFPQFVKDGKDMSNVSGFADMPYALANVRLTNPLVQNGIPVGYWRAVNHSQNVFFREGAIDELAIRANADPIAYRRALVGDNARLQATLDALAADMAAHPLPPSPAGTRRGRGVAFSTSHGAVCGQVVDIAMVGGALKVERVFCAIDVGTAVNPGIVTTQMEGSIIDGLSFALFGGLSLQNGGVAEGNFDRIRLLKIGETPEIVVQVLEWPEATVGGVGEPGLPPLAPALTAAIFRATGQRIRRLPISAQGLGLGV